MAKKYGVLLLVAVLAVVIINFSVSDTGDTLVLAYTPECSTVDKAAGDAFKVKIAFKNTGKTTGTWSINIAFEDSDWSQAGTPQNLTLTPGQTETLVWNGVVPANATVGSVARLVVYYDDSCKALNWWIRVVPGAELTIKSSIVE
jgi:FtsP/CotA-like multicopper oxidase with cupredoxin domain